MPALLLLPVESMLRKVSPLAAIVVLATFSAVPVVDVSVLAAPVITSVPPPVAVKPAFAAELMVTFEKLKVALPLLPVRLAPVPPFVLSPVKVSVPAILAKLTPVPAVVVTVTLFSTKAPVIVAELVTDSSGMSTGWVSKLRTPFAYSRRFKASASGYASLSLICSQCVSTVLRLIESSLAIRPVP